MQGWGRCKERECPRSRGLHRRVVHCNLPIQSSERTPPSCKDTTEKDKLDLPVVDTKGKCERCDNPPVSVSSFNPSISLLTVRNLAVVNGTAKTLCESLRCIDSCSEDDATFLVLKEMLCLDVADNLICSIVCVTLNHYYGVPNVCACC